MRRAGELLLAAALVVLSAWAALAGSFWGFALRCDDSCSPTSGQWRDDPDAWQWSALGWAGIGAAVLALLVFTLILSRRTAAAAVAFAAWGAAGVAYLVFLTGSGLA